MTADARTRALAALDDLHRWRADAAASMSATIHPSKFLRLRAAFYDQRVAPVLDALAEALRAEDDAPAPQSEEARS